MTTGTDTGVHKIFDLSSDYLDRLAALRPIASTYMGIPGHDHRWDDTSPEGGEILRAFLREAQEELAALPKPEDRWAKLAIEIMAEHLKLEIAHFDDGDDVLDLNNIASTFQGIRQVFDVQNTSTPEAWNAIVTRVETIAQPLAGYHRTLAKGLAAGKTVAVRQVKAVVEQARVQQGPQSFFHRLPQMMKDAGVTDPALVTRLEAAVPRACLAFAAFGDWLEKSYQPHAKLEDGVGRERYLRQTRRFLGMTIDPEETYAWGWREIHTIEQQMKDVAAQILPGATLPQVLELLKTDKTRAAKDRATFIQLMIERQMRALKELEGEHFDVPEPVRKVDVKIAPPGGALGAYYNQPTEDFSRPGTVWYSLAPDEQTDLPLYEHITTAYHEGFPGHHLQCAIQLTLAGRLSRLHRLAVWYPGYGEGWALYAEQLMNELGYFEKPDYVLGMLNAQLFRACRVVIDIGCHLGFTIPASEKEFHPGAKWTYELGVELMEKRAFQDPAYAASEVTRYLGWPGQAISYKVGQRAILELREELKKKKGAAFSLKDFHARVLGSGPVGLELLRDLVLAD